MLQQAPHSTLARSRIDNLNYLALALVSCAHNAVTYTYEPWALHPLVIN
jgi:hypothetical protein